MGRRRSDVMDLDVSLLGHFSVRQDGSEVPLGAFGGRLPRRLVRLLALRRGQVVHREELIEALWGDDPPADPDANLNVLVNRARRALGRPEAIETVADGYMLRAGPDIHVDVETLLDAAAAAAAHANADRPLAALDEAGRGLDVWGGEPLAEDRYAGWARHHQERLTQARQQLLEIAAAAALDIGHDDRAADLAQQAVEAAPLREPAHLLRIRALAARGDRAGALAGFAELRRRLDDELGLDPSDEAEQVHLQVLHGTVPGGASRHGTPPAGGPPLPFVGRERLLSQLLASLRRSEPTTVLVAGRSGAGKSRLLAEAASRLRQPSIALRAYLPDREEPWSLVRALLHDVCARDEAVVATLGAHTRQALADVIPAFVTPDPEQTLARDSRHALVREGAAQLVEAATADGGVVIVDDLQWCDASSLTLLARLAGRRPGLHLALAYRPEEVVTATPTRRFLGDAEAAGAVTFELPALDVTALGGMVRDDALTEVLARDTDGTPFAITEVIRELFQAGRLVRGGDGRLEPSSDDVHDRAVELARAGQRRSVTHRARRQPPERHELLTMLALLGREAPAALLAGATGRPPPAVLEDLHALARAELARLGPHGWAPAHDLVGESVGADVPPAQAGRLHHLLAGALEATGADAAEQARHLAGAGDHAAAAGAYAAAARERIEHAATTEAGELAQAGLDLDPPPAIQAALLRARADSRASSGQLAGARDDLRHALRTTSAGPERARSLARLAMLTLGAEDLARADGLVRLALAEAGGDRGARARALAVSAIVDMNLHRSERSAARADEALMIFEELGDAAGIAQILDGRAIATLLDGNVAAAVDDYDRVARLFVDTGDLLRAVTPRSTRGHALVFQGRAREGLDDIERALELARSLGHPEGETYALWHRSEALIALGRCDDGLASAERALDIARDLGHRGWTATALLGCGLAHSRAGRFAEAIDALDRSLAAAEAFPLFTCLAAARRARVAIVQQELDTAAELLTQARDVGPALGMFEVRLARVELADAAGEPEVARLADEALRIARDSGCHLHDRELVELGARA